MLEKETIQYYKDKFKSIVYEALGGEERKLKSAMHSVLLQLRAKDNLPANMIAIELFGMHGLWHTRDYIQHVSHLDIFEINPKYHALSKRALSDYPVHYHLADSIAYISSTDKRYNLVVADIPFGGDFYTASGLPYFFSQLIRVCDKNAVLIMNMHTRFLPEYKAIEERISAEVTDVRIKDLFFVPRNMQISYIVLCIEKSA